MLKIISSNRFRRDLKLAKKSGYDISLLQNVVNRLVAKQPLDIKYHDHELSGTYIGFRECHIQPDWLLIYRIENDTLELFLFRTGTHSDLF